MTMEMQLQQEPDEKRDEWRKLPIGMSVEIVNNENGRTIDEKETK